MQDSNEHKYGLKPIRRFTNWTRQTTALFLNIPGIKK
jgi:hypothetical protein